MPAQSEVGSGKDQRPIAWIHRGSEPFDLRRAEMAAFVADHRRKRDAPARRFVDDTILLGKAHHRCQQVVNTLDRVGGKPARDERQDEVLDIVSGDGEHRPLPEARNEMCPQLAPVAISGPFSQRDLLIEVSVGPSFEGDTRRDGI
jgi:hypothetical protein